jgi:hypothetical protein
MRWTLHNCFFMRPDLVAQQVECRGPRCCGEHDPPCEQTAELQLIYILTPDSAVMVAPMSELSRLRRQRPFLLVFPFAMSPA